MLVEFNLNEMVRIKLTEKALQIHRQDFDDFVRETGLKDMFYLPPLMDKDGWHKEQLWQLMRLYGPHMYNGGPVLFEKLTIQIVKEV